jgi:cobalamin biosynthesis protein CobT
MAEPTRPVFSRAHDDSDSDDDDSDSDQGDGFSDSDTTTDNDKEQISSERMLGTQGEHDDEAVVNHVNNDDSDVSSSSLSDSLSKLSLIRSLSKECRYIGLI